MGCGTLATLGLGLAGTGLSLDASLGEQRNMNNAVNWELGQQQGFQKKATPVFQQSLAQSTPQAMTGQQAAGQQQFLNASRNAALTPLSLPSQVSGQTDNASNIAYQGQQARNQLSQGNNAALQGYSNIGLQQYLKDLSANSQLGLINNQAQQTLGILPSLLQGAQQSRSGESAIGSLLGTAGLLTGLGSASGLFGQAPMATGGQFSNLLGRLPSSGQMSFDPLLGNYFQLP